MAKGLTGGQYHLHPQPRRVSIYNTSSFSFGPASLPITTFENGSPGSVDFMRFRMERLWFQENSAGTIATDEEAPIQIAKDSMGAVIGYIPPVQLTNHRQEKVTIGYNSEYLNAVGTEPVPALDTPDKWLFVIDDGNLADGFHTTPSPSPHGIVSTFSDIHIDGNSTNPVHFSDYVLDYQTPLNKKEVGDNYYGSLTVFQAEVKPVYNFYAQAYESILTSSQDPNEAPYESMLPSLYSFLSVMGNEDIATKGMTNDKASIDTIFERHITLDKSIPGTRISTEVTYNAGGRSQTVEADVSKGQYFDKYAYTFAEAVKSTITPKWRQGGLASGQPSLKDKFKNQIVPMSDIDMFATFNEMANRFPMYCEVNFSTSNTLNSEVVKLFEDTELMPSLLKDFVDGTSNSSWQAKEMNFNFLSSNDMPFTGSNYTEDTNSLVSGKLKCWDMNGWISGLSHRSTFDKPVSGVFLGQYNPEVTLPNTSMTRRFQVLLFKSKMQHIINTKTRTWLDMVNGVKAYHETVFYTVEKYEAGTDGFPISTTPIQTFYFPNSLQLDEHHFTDTQVKYGKRYIYRIYAFEMVFGTEYWYQLDQAPIAGFVDPNINQQQARICINSRPSVKLVKVPYYQKEVVMMDSPPVWPDLEVITYKNVRDEIAFWFTGNAGDYKIKPIMIQPGDEEIMNSIRLAQEVGVSDAVRFKSDDHARAFEVFRLDKKPKRYADFRGAKIAEIETNININQQCQFSTSAAWIDKSIKPNQKYYYTFRTIDNHNHFSNPSPVYELEMVYDGYAPFLLRNVYYLDESAAPPQKPVKKFTKYIYIKPALAQKMINEQESGLKNQNGDKIAAVDVTDGLTAKQIVEPDGSWIHLGVADQTLWDKAMKIRVISKKTGKRIDLNIKFTKSHRIFEEGNSNNLC